MYQRMNFCEGCREYKNYKVSCYLPEQLLFSYSFCGGIFVLDVCVALVSYSKGRKVEVKQK